LESLSVVMTVALLGVRMVGCLAELLVVQLVGLLVGTLAVRLVSQMAALSENYLVV
jgi:hypothetical protein